MRPETKDRQAKMLEAIRQVGGRAFLVDIAEYFEVSEATARRDLDGLAYQGKLIVEPGFPPSTRYPQGRPRLYRIPEEGPRVNL